MYTVSRSTATTMPWRGSNAFTNSSAMSAKVAPMRSASPASTGEDTRIAISPTAASARPTRITASPPAAGSQRHHRLVDPENSAKAVADFPQGGRRLHRVHEQRHEVGRPPRRHGQGIEGAGDAVPVAPGPEPVNPLLQGLAERGVNLKEVGGRRLVGDELVHTHHDPGSLLDL